MGSWEHINPEASEEALVWIKTLPAKVTENSTHVKVIIGDII